MSDSIVLPSVFPTGYGKFTGMTTGLKAKEFFEEDGNRKGQDWQDYSMAMHALQQAAQEASMTPDEKAARENTQKAAVVLGVGILAVGAGGLVAAKMGAFRPNPAIYKKGSVRAAMAALNIFDDTNTDLVTNGEGLLLIDGTDAADGGEIVFVIHLTDVPDGLKVEIRRPENDATQKSTLPQQAKNILASVLGASNIQTAFMQTLTQAAASIGSTVTVAGETLQEGTLAAMWWPQLWEKLDKAFQETPTAVPGAGFMEAMRDIIN